MKKFFAFLMTAVMLAALCVSAYAATGEFLDSPSLVSEPELIKAEPSNHECTAKLLITAYANRNTLDDATRAIIEKAYDDIANSAVINGQLKTEFEAIAADKKLDMSDFVAGTLFDVSYFECEQHTSHRGFTITIAPEVVDNYVGLIHFDGEKWTLVDSTLDKDAGTITFYVDSLSPFALVYSTKSTQTGDSSSAWIYVVLMVVSAASIGVIGYKLSKKEN